MIHGGATEGAASRAEAEAAELLDTVIVEERFRERFEAEWAATAATLERVQGGMGTGVGAAGPMAIGMAVEALSRTTVTDEHALFYSGTVTAVTTSDDAGLRFTIHFEDGTTESDIHPITVRPNCRVTVYEDEFLRVVDGHIAVRGIARPARLLAFQSSPQLYQSAVMLRDGAPVFDSLPFEQLQALCVPLVFYKSRMTSEPLQPVRVALVGAGGGTTPMTIQAQFPGATDMDVVELSQVIVDVACNHFGLREDPERLRVHVQDGVQFLEEAAAAAFDVVMLDAADSDAPSCSDDPDALELPPAAFATRDFLTVVLRSMAPDGVCVCNVIAGRRRLLDVVRLWDNTFSSVRILATDPNYFLVGTVRPLDAEQATPECMAQNMRGWAPLAQITRDVTAMIADTARHLRERTLIGWLTVEEFVALLDDPDVIV